jgi:hypothetical protein
MYQFFYNLKEKILFHIVSFSKGPRPEGSRLPTRQDVQFCSEKLERNLERKRLQDGPRGSASRFTQSNGRYRFEQKPKTTETRQQENDDKNHNVKMIGRHLLMLLCSF